MKNLIKEILISILDSLTVLLKYKKVTGAIQYINSEKRFNSKKWIKERIKIKYKFIKIIHKEYKDVWGSYKYVYTLECWEPVS